MLRSRATSTAHAGGVVSGLGRRHLFTLDATRMSAAEVKDALAELASPERAKASAWFFKTGPGQYGEGDRFIGVSVPNQRQVAKRFGEEPLAELAELLASPIHEERLTGLLILVRQYERAASSKRGDAAQRDAIYDFYVEHLGCVNNWDLVDSSASYIVGRHLLHKPRAARRVLSRWARSRNQWERRVAVIATMAFIDEGQFEDTLALAEQLLTDEQDLIHKAVGWTLREVGKRDVAALRGFLDAHHTVMPRTMLRYAIEKLSQQERQRYMKKPPRGT